MNPIVAKKIKDAFSDYPPRTYPRGQILIYGGEDSDEIFYLESGKIREYDISYRGDELALTVFKPGAFFPMNRALNDMPIPYFFKTEAESVVRVMPAAKALEFVKANPDVLLDLLKRVYIGLDGLLGRMVELMSSTAKRRLIYELLVEARRFGEKVKDNSCELTVSEIDLAARSGLSRETVSREMHSLKEQKLVSLRGPKIILPDISSLEQKISL